MPPKLLSYLSWLPALLMSGLFLSPLLTIPPQDFAQFYFAGRLTATGQVARVYHKPAYEPLVTELRAQGEYVSPYHYFNRPSFVALFCAPLAWFSYRSSLWLTVLGNVGLLILIVWKFPAWFRTSGSVRPWLFLFMPFMWSIGYGQDTLLLTLLIGYSLHLNSKQIDVPAGMCLAMCTAKPHLIWATPLALLVGKKHKWLYSFLATGLLLALVSFTAVGVNGLAEWLELISEPTTDYMPEHTTVRL